MSSEIITPDSIAVFVPSLRGGGAERVAVIFANAAAARGLRVALLIAKAEGPYLSDVSSEVRVIELGASRVISSLPSLIRYLRGDRPEALLTLMYHTNLIGIIARQVAGVPTRVVVSERNALSYSLSASTALHQRLLPKLMHRLYPLADGVVAISNGVASDLADTIDYPKDRIQVIYNPIASPKQLAGNVNHPWFAAGEPPVILGAGRLCEQKDFGTLISAFAAALSKRHLRLVIIGEGAKRPELQAQIDALGLSDHVALPGFVDNPSMWMRSSSVFALSSAWEGFGNVLVEAMACGTPVVSTDCPHGPAEILENGRWGRLVPVGDVEGLARAIIETLDDANLPEAKTRADNFSVDRAVDGYLRVMGLDK